MGLILFGLRNRNGAVVYHPEREILPDGPLPLFRTRREVVAVIERLDLAKRGFHVVEFEIQENVEVSR